MPDEILVLSLCMFLFLELSPSSRHLRASSWTPPSPPPPPIRDSILISSSIVVLLTSSPTRFSQL